MRKTWLPIVVCIAIGAIVVTLVKLGEEPQHHPRPRPKPAARKPVPPAKPDPFAQPIKTPTGLHDNKPLRELERAMAREDLKHARFFRQQVCEEIDQILRSEKLTKNLFDLIKKYGINSQDAARRDIVLPMLRVIRHPEATTLIEQEYYKAGDEKERMMLLEAMSHDYHNPEEAAEWALERAINATDPEERHRAYEVVDRFSGNPKLVTKLAIQIYSASTRPKQRDQMLESISDHSANEPAAADFLRGLMKNPRPEELIHVITQIEGWGNEDDAAQLDELAEEFPAMGDQLRERARALRIMLKTGRGKGTDEARMEEERRAVEIEAKRKRDEAARKRADGAR